MRIEMRAGGLMGTLDVSMYQATFNSFSNSSSKVRDDFDRVVSSFYSLNGGVGNLQNAVSLIQQRIRQESQKQENIQITRQETNKFLSETVATDRKVATIVDKNNDDFYRVSPHLKPSLPAISNILDKVTDILFRVVEPKMIPILPPDWIGYNFQNIAAIIMEGVEEKTNKSETKSVEDFFMNAWIDERAFRIIKGVSTEDIIENERKKVRSRVAEFINNELKASGSVISGELKGEGEFLGASTAGSVRGDLLYGEAGIKSKMGWKFKDKDGNWDFKSFGLSTEAKATGALARGEVQGNWGYLHGKAEGKAITAAASGEVKATLWDDGKFNPSLYAGIKAEASVLQGSADVGLGTDQFGVYAKASGDVLHAEAEAKAGIGYVRTGKDTKAYGVSAEASAMASIAQGKASAGFSLFGIDIGIGAKGYAGAAGVEIGGSITTSGVKGNFGGALGLGAGLEISVDWSDAKWIGDTIDWFGDVGSTIYDGASSFVSGAYDVVTDIGDFLFGWW